jgi:PPOX class probable F420-dependent enzyme
MNRRQLHQRISPMTLTDHLLSERASHVQRRLHRDLITWLTTVRPDGQPVSVPVWFLLRDDETILIYSRPNKNKLRNIECNPRVTLGLDMTDCGRDVIRIDGTARLATEVVPVDQNLPYIAKYAERINAVFGTPENLASLFSVPLLITPTRLKDYQSLH